MNKLEHPDITMARETGYPTAQEPGLMCDFCKQEIAPGEYYGEYAGMRICRDCVDIEWQSLTDKEKFERLGYDAEYYG